jgi:arylsulfatase A-like enzyme
MNRLGALVLSLFGAFVALVALIIVLAPAHTPAAAAEQPPNVIIVMVDALRPDHVSSYGYAQPTTPNLDSRLAAAGTRFLDVTSASSWTYPANAAMLTGRMPADIGVHWHSNDTRIPESETMLAEHLKAAGYTTAGFVNAFYVWPRFGFGDGFDTYQVVQSGLNGDAAQVNAAAFEWLDANWTPAQQTGPLFLYLYYYDPHTVYAPPPPYDLLYDSTYTGTLTGEAFNNGERVVSGEIVPTARDIEHLKALYDGEVTHWDTRFGEMMDHLADLGVLDNALVLLTADHGQMFGEHGEWTHHNSLYEEVVRVPMVISWPGVLPAGQVITAPVTTMDVTPTLLHLLGLPVPDDVAGQDLTSLLNGGPADPERPIYSELSGETAPTNPHFWNSPSYEQRAVKRAGWKFIHEIRNPAADQLFEVLPASQYEVDNLIDTAPDQAQSLREILFEWFTVPTHFSFLAPVQGSPTPLRAP